ncbi:hypothetical protein, partial [Vibrio sp. DNB22_19_2]
MLLPTATEAVDLTTEAHCEDGVNKKERSEALLLHGLINGPIGVNLNRHAHIAAQLAGGERVGLAAQQQLAVA